MTIDTGSRSPLRGFWLSHESNQFFVTSYNDGKIYGYEINGTLKTDFIAQKVFTAAGPLYPRSVIFVDALNKVVVSYESGLILFYDIGLPNFPVCWLSRLPEDPHRNYHQNRIRSGEGDADFDVERQNDEILAF